MSSKLKSGTTNACNIEVLNNFCEVNEILRKISPRWKMQILHSIKHGTRQFSLLKKNFPSLSDQVLGKRLAELVEDNLLEKTTIEDTAPPQVTYNVTGKGEELLVVIDDLHRWGLSWK